MAIQIRDLRHKFNVATINLRNVNRTLMEIVW